MSDEFRKRDRAEILQLLAAMVREYERAATAYKEDAVEQIQHIERGSVTDVGEALHRAVHAIAFMRLVDALQELEGMAEGRRSTSCWTAHDR